MATFRIKAIVLVMLCYQIVQPAYSEQLPPPAYQLAADKQGIPAIVLYAVALQESGFLYKGNVTPWPWTLNIAGKAHWFKTKEEACQTIRQAIKTTSSKRIDVGLGQLNIGYFGQRVKEPCQLLDPYTNLDIAASILKQHYQSTDDWLIAIGRYHRPAGGKPAIRYRQQVKNHLARLLNQDLSHVKTLEL